MLTSLLFDQFGANSGYQDFNDRYTSVFSDGTRTFIWWWKKKKLEFARNSGKKPQWTGYRTGKVGYADTGRDTSISKREKEMEGKKYCRGIQRCAAIFRFLTKGASLNLLNDRVKRMWIFRTKVYESQFIFIILWARTNWSNVKIKPAYLWYKKKVHRSTVICRMCITPTLSFLYLGTYDVKNDRW